MTIDFDSSKQFTVRAAKTAKKLAKEYVQASVKATTDGFTFTVHVRVRGKRGPLPTT